MPEVTTRQQMEIQGLKGALVFSVLPARIVCHDAYYSRKTDCEVGPPAASAAPTFDPRHGVRCEDGVTPREALGANRFPSLLLKRNRVV